MSWFEIALFIAALILMLIGQIGIILPVIPGVPIIFISYLLFGLFTEFAHTTTNTIIIFAILTALSFILDWVATVFGVRKMGGSNMGMLGAFLGMIVGLFLPGVGIFGFVIGAFVGAVIFELLMGKTSKIAFRAGLGSFIGFLAGGLLKFIIGAIMIGIFIRQTLF